ncbi:MAG: MerR family transcriptional regulator [Angustibacter sp.]
MLTVAAVARRLGVAPATLRTWARRYGLGPSEHTAGSHRRYNPEDLSRLLVMRRLTHEGMSPAQAARMALAEDALSPTSATAAALGDYRLAELVAASASQARTPAAPASFHGSGGRVVPLPAASPAVRGLARAAMALDAYGVSEVLRRAVRVDGVVAAWETLATPVLAGLGERFVTTKEGIEVEHLFSECLLGVFRAATDKLTTPRNTVPVLLACPDEEQHSLPLYAAQAALAERGVLARQLGMRVPPYALHAAVRRIGPGAVLLYATMATSSIDALVPLGRSRPAPRILLGGPGWPAAPPAPMSRVLTLSHAVDDILATVL